MFTVLENDVVVGTFTHRVDYLPNLLKSVKECIPNVPFIVQIADLPINRNFEELRRKFKETGKRFWLFLDDDIEFVDPETINKALKTLVNGKYAMVGVYSSFDPAYIPTEEEMPEKEITWMPGYFQLVDSLLVGDIGADLDLPCPNTSIDTSYSIDIKLRGYKIGIAPTYVRHAYKESTWCDLSKVEITNKYLFEKYGKYYFDNCHGLFNIVGGKPEIVYNRLPFFVDLDYIELVSNRTKLINWQQIEHYKDEPNKVKIHLGCGTQHYPGHINADLYVDSADMQFSLSEIPFENNSVDALVSHHALEHTLYRTFNSTLKEWHRVLKIGGTLELGIPDIELCCKAFLLSEEQHKWDWSIYTLYGQQGSTHTLPKYLTDLDPIHLGQVHSGGVSLKRLKYLLENLGFELLELYNYDGFGTPSIFAYARKVR